jgi:hypothetical protein
MSDSLFSVSGISDVAASAVTAGAPPHAGPAQAVRDFETLFIETWLQHSGIAQALQTGEGPEGGVTGELLIRELARGLADQLKLGFGRTLGVEGAQ